MIRDGTYLYSEYWGLRINQSITRAATVPDPVLLTGDFSSIADPIIDPDTGFPFPGNRIPAARLNNEGLALARLYPAPNVFDGSPFKIIALSERCKRAPMPSVSGWIIV